LGKRIVYKISSKEAKRRFKVCTIPVGGETISKDVKSATNVILFQGTVMVHFKKGVK
jgi:hypothetical protein